MKLDIIRIFVKVAQNGSFSKAAEILKLPKSTISKAIAQLEKETGTKLMLRTTRSLSLTAAGRVFYDASLAPIQVLEDAQKSLIGGDSLISGLIRITAPEDLGFEVISPIIAKLSIRYPQLRFDIKYTNEVIDLVKEGFDIAVRIGRLNASSFKVKRAGEIVLIAVASPKYLSKREKICSPHDLIHHDCLTYNDQAYKKWTFRSSKSTTRVQIKTKISINHMRSLLRVALADSGVALVPKLLCENEINSGKLVRVLDEWTSPGLPVSVISPLSSASSARLKITIDQILEHLRTSL